MKQVLAGWLVFLGVTAQAQVQDDTSSAFLPVDAILTLKAGVHVLPNTTMSAMVTDWDEDGVTGTADQCDETPSGVTVHTAETAPSPDLIGCSVDGADFKSDLRTDANCVLVHDSSKKARFLGKVTVALTDVTTETGEEEHSFLGKKKIVNIMVQTPKGTPLHIQCSAWGWSPTVGDLKAYFRIELAEPEPIE